MSRGCRSEGRGGSAPGRGTGSAAWWLWHEEPEERKKPGAGGSGARKTGDVTGLSARGPGGLAEGFLPEARSWRL